jgi:hypothetical protein
MFTSIYTGWNSTKCFSISVLLDFVPEPDSEIHYAVKLLPVWEADNKVGSGWALKRLSVGDECNIAATYFKLCLGFM